MMRLNVVFFSCCLVECLRWQQRKQTLGVISTFVLWETPALPRVKYSSKMYFTLSGMSSVTEWLACEQAYLDTLGAGRGRKKEHAPSESPTESLLPQLENTALSFDSHYQLWWHLAQFLLFSVLHQQPLFGENAPYALLWFSCALGSHVTELLLPLNHNCSLFAGHLFLNRELKQGWQQHQQERPKNNYWLRLAKQQLSTCITLFCIFLCHHCRKRQPINSYGLMASTTQLQ